MLCEDASFLKAFGKVRHYPVLTQLQTEQDALELALAKERTAPVSYTHLRAHET